MPSYFVQQPNGLLARFSTIVDDFTHLNMTEDEAAAVILQEAEERAKLEVKQALERSKLDRNRWKDCLSTVQRIHGPEVAAEREKQAADANGDESPCDDSPPSVTGQLPSV